ncbi:MAG: hypothetical protein ACK5LC_03230 [Coprobacillaceae bacterium]
MADLVVTQRSDADGYVEGLTYGQAIMIGLGKRAWLVPNQTFTQHVLNAAGQVLIPVYEPGTLQGATDLCEEGTFNKATQRFETLLLDKKVGGEFDGCFTVAGIARTDWERHLNNATLTQMAMDYQVSVETALQAGGTTSTVDATGLSASQYLLKLKSEYFTLNKQQARIALVNDEFYNEILDQQINLGTAGSDFAFINGVVGTVSGLTIIQTQMATKAILLNANSIHLSVAGSPKQVPQFGNIIGDNDLSSLNVGFSAGIISKTDVKPTFIGANTYVHLPFGVKVIDKLVLKTPTIPTP